MKNVFHVHENQNRHKQITWATVGLHHYKPKNVTLHWMKSSHTEYRTVNWMKFSYTDIVTLHGITSSQIEFVTYFTLDGNRHLHWI